MRKVKQNVKYIYFLYIIFLSVSFSKDIDGKVLYFFSFALAQFGPVHPPRSTGSDISIECHLHKDFLFSWCITKENIRYDVDENIWADQQDVNENETVCSLMIFFVCLFVLLSCHLFFSLLWEVFDSVFS